MVQNVFSTPVYNPVCHPPYPSTPDGIRQWGKVSKDSCILRSLENPTIVDNWDGCASSWLDDRLEEFRKIRAIWQASFVFDSKHPDLQTREFWQSCPMTEDEFTRALALYFRRETKKHGAFGVDYADLLPATYMTEEQQMSYIWLLSKKNPKILAEHFRDWTCSERQIETGFRLLSEKTPQNLLLVDKFVEDKWSDLKSHPELQEFLVEKEKEILTQKVFENPWILQYLKTHVVRLEMNFTEDQRADFFYRAALSNPAFYTTYKEILNPSKKLENAVLESLFESGNPGCVSVYHSTKTEWTLEEQERYTEQWMRSNPFDALLNASMSKHQKEKAFKSCIQKDPNHCAEPKLSPFFKALNPAQRKEIISFIYKKDPELLLKLNFEGIPENEKQKYIENYVEFVGFRKVCILLSDPSALAHSVWGGLCDRVSACFTFEKTEDPERESHLSWIWEKIDFSPHLED